MGVVLLLKTLVDAAGVWLLDVWGLGMATMEKNGTDQMGLGLCSTGMEFKDGCLQFVGADTEWS